MYGTAIFFKKKAGATIIRSDMYGTAFLKKTVAIFMRSYMYGTAI